MTRKKNCKSKNKDINKTNQVIIIPAYNPADNLIKIIEEISKDNYLAVIIVDDGSTSKCSFIFSKLEKMNDIILLKHAINLGKGAALKTAFNYILLNYTDVSGVITVDADGQHLPEDINKISARLAQKSNLVVLGTRSFAKDVPFRSLIGNKLTKFIFGLLVGKTISDTQTGLRGMPLDFLKELMLINSNRYEFELEMLIKACNSPNYLIEQLPIKTVYLNNNESSHFNPLLDSLKIYFVFIRFIASSLLASIFDFVSFSIFIYFTNELLLSLTIARIIGLVTNFLLNKKIVFHTSRKKTTSEILKFSLLAIFLFVLSYSGIKGLVYYLHFNYYTAKILTDAVLFIISFAVQKTIVFSSYCKD